MLDGYTPPLGLLVRREDECLLSERPAVSLQRTFVPIGLGHMERSRLTENPFQAGYLAVCNGGSSNL
jgi:hypothetical protein